MKQEVPNGDEAKGQEHKTVEKTGTKHENKQQKVEKKWETRFGLEICVKKVKEFEAKAGEKRRSSLVTICHADIQLRGVPLYLLYYYYLM